MADLPSEGAHDLNCVHSERCGGCPLIGLPYAEQLAQKQTRVARSLDGYAALSIRETNLAVGADPVVGYRTRAKLVVGNDGEVGLFARGGVHEVLDIPECRVLSPVLSLVAAALRSRIRRDLTQRGPLAPHGVSGGLLRALDLREVRVGSERGVLVTLVVQESPRFDRASLRAVAKQLAVDVPQIIGVAVNRHGGLSPQVLGPETFPLHGVSRAYDEVGQTRHLATFGSFVQAHRGQAERIHALIRNILELGERVDASPKIVLDLYGGTGAIGLAMAAAGARVELVESFAPAAAHAEKAAKEQGLSLSATSGDVAMVLRELVEGGRKVDAAVINPPRRGTSPHVRHLLSRLGPQDIVYVSCDPDTLARDLDDLQRSGYTTRSVTPFDMIPLTDEVETVAWLRRAPAPSPRVLYEDGDILVVVKPPHEPVTPESDHPRSLADRVRNLPNARSVVALHALDAATSGLMIFARSATRSAPWKEALTAPGARTIYLGAVRGITPMKGCVTRRLRDDTGSAVARTRYRRLAIMSGHSVLRFVPESGFGHHVRRHMAAVGHPLLGDARYGHAPTNRFFEERNGLDRTFLHCVRIELTHPHSGAHLVFEAPLPGDLRMVLRRTGGHEALQSLDQKHALGAEGLVPPRF